MGESMVSEPTSWYLVQVKPNCQRIAQRNLDRQGFVTFLPQHEVTRRIRNRFRVETRPLFPGYLFVAFTMGRGGWRAVNSTHGVTRLVGFGGTPAEVPGPLVAGLMARCDASGRLSGGSDPKPGDAVRIVAGPFTDFVARVQDIDAERRVCVLLDLMGRTTRAVLRGEDLRPAETRGARMPGALPQ